jgi:hypothetical protein
MTRALALPAMLLLAASCVQVYPPSAAGPTPSAAAGAAAAAKKPDDKGPFKPWAEATKDTRAVDGYFRTHPKRDHALLLEIRPDQLDRDFGMVLHLSRGVGVFNVHDGLPLTEMQLMRFRRVGDKVFLVRRNTRFTADPGSPMLASLEENTGHSVTAAFKIESEEPQTKALLVDLSPWLVSDYAQVSEQLKFYHARKPVMFDREKSVVAKVMGFPQNVEIDVDLTYGVTEPSPFGSAGVSDWRSIPVGVRYSLVALPEQPMRPRLGDARVGHFLDAVRDFSRDREMDQFRAYVTRWRLEKKDAGAELSEPVRPIVYYIDRSVPREYRGYVKEGVEAWNKAFQKAGFRSAIVAREAPENDSTWSAEDARYSTVRWTAAHQMGYAIGPSQTDPRTGEILNADILISSNFVRGWNHEYQTLAGPEGMIQQFQRAEQLQRQLPEPLANRLCLAEMGKSHQLAMQHTLLAGLGVIDGTSPMPEEYVGNAIRDLVMHEVGHTLGLRHNFKGSSAIPYDRLNDRAFTRQNGLTLSVMDYAAVNVAADPKRQGHHVNVEVGAYDVWAIQYAYQPVPAATTEDEVPALRRIAAQASSPLHAYNTDEDTHLGPWSVDPTSNTWDLGSDPLRWARDRGALVSRVLPNIEARLLSDGDAYPRLRSAVTGLIFERYMALLPATKMVGGLYFARDHRGDPGARVPFTPVPAAEQREAVQLIVREAFAPEAFRLEPSLLNRLAPNRLAHWGTGYFNTPVDYPLHAQVGAVQEGLLKLLLHPVRLRRMIDNEAQVPAGTATYSVSELLQTLSSSIWSELGSGAGTARPANSFRRNLQRAYTQQLIDILLGPPAGPAGPAGPAAMPAPEHARSLARLELVELSQRINAALAAASLDRDGRAHLMETQARVGQALQASLSLPHR